MTPARVRGIIQRLVIGVAAAGVIYLFLRFETLNLQRERAAPILRYGPGSLLIIDTWARAYEDGDAALVELDSGLVLLALGGRLTDGDFAVDRREEPQGLRTDWPEAVATDSLRGRVILAFLP